MCVECLQKKAPVGTKLRTHTVTQAPVTTSPWLTSHPVNQGQDQPRGRSFYTGFLHGRVVLLNKVHALLICLSYTVSQSSGLCLSLIHHTRQFV